jgi:hypothetical protein
MNGKDKTSKPPHASRVQSQFGAYPGVILKHWCKTMLGNFGVGEFMRAASLLAATEFVLRRSASRTPLWSLLDASHHPSPDQ